MEIITKEYKVYKFDELKSEIQDKVLDDFRWQEVNDDIWYEMELENISNYLEEEYGIEVASSKIYFDLNEGWLSLGEEVSITNMKNFIMKIIDNKVLVAQILSNPDWKIENIDLHIGNNGRRGNYIDVLCNGHNYEDGDERWDEEECKKILEEELQIDLDDCINTLNKKMYKQVEEQRDYITSDEHIKENIEMNEYKFLEDGSIF